MDFDLREITPYVTIFGPPIACVAALDFVLNDSVKNRVWLSLKSTAEIAKNPFSFSFYGFTTLSSVFTTLAIITISGLVESRGHGIAGILIGLKSSTALLLAVVFKVLLLDYLWALKSAGIIESLEKAQQGAAGFRKMGRWSFVVVAAILVSGDIFVTAVLTAGVLNWWEVFQSANMPSAVPENIRKSLGFFDELNLFLNDSLQRSFYALNGTLLMYLSIAIAAAGAGITPHLAVEDIKKNIFKLTACGLALIVLIVAIARAFAR